MTIQEIIRKAEQNYVHGSTMMSKYVNWSMHETLERIDAYVNSKHTSGDVDSLGREKPFFNIVTGAVNIWYRATDLDRKNIRVMPNGTKQILPAFIASIFLQKWMDEARFGVFLNQWGRTLAKYGSAVVKFVEQDGELKAMVVPWNRLIVDPIDFNAIPRIEKFYVTPEQLRKSKEYNQEVVDNLIEASQGRENLDGQKKDNQSGFIELYEVHGEMSAATYKASKGMDVEEGDENDYYQQMHVVSYVQNEQGEYSDFTLYCGREAKDPYMLTHLIEEDGRTLGIGAVEYLFDSQWMQNHTMKQWKDQIDLASRIIFQTADTNFMNRNVLSYIETGDILTHKENMPLTQISNSGRDVASIQAFANQWKVLSQDLTSTPDAIRGNTLPSGTPYSLGAYLGEQANSLFEIMTENKGLAIEDMLRGYVIPHIRKKLNTKEEIVAILDEQGITQIDEMYIPKMAVTRFNNRVVEPILEGELVEPFNPEVEEQAVKDELAPLGNQRFFTPDSIGKKTWNDILKDLEWKLKVEVTNENVDKGSVLTTLTSLYQTLAQTDPEKANLILGKILSETSVVSPLEIAAKVRPTTPAGAEALSAVAKEKNVRS